LFWHSHRTIGSYWSIRIEIKKEHRLVTRGSYRYVRHPLYTALFLGYLGTLLALQSWTLTVWFPVFIASYLLFAKEEERVMENGFGEAYRAYRQQTGMFLPRLTSMRVPARRAAKHRGARRTEA
jgi:protein-S-isoprenylcysteine O-methyltransferase Ste14